jgi:hypothetical protein
MRRIVAIGAVALVVTACSGDDDITSLEAVERAAVTAVDTLASAATGPPGTTAATEPTAPPTTEPETTTIEKRQATTTQPPTTTTVAPTTTQAPTTTTIPKYPLDVATITANAYAQGIDVSTCSFPKTITEPITVDCLVENPDGSAGTWTVTVNIDQSVSGSYLETKAAPVFVDIDSRTWDLIARDPDAHEGEMYRVYGYVTQADSATGVDTIRANVEGQVYDDWYDYDVNTIITDQLGTNDLVSVVQGDLFVAEVTVIGSFTYDTQIGGSTTVPLLSLYSIAVTGHED